MTIRVGAPLTALPGEDARQLTERLTATLRAMVAEVVAGYPDRPGDGDTWWLPASAGGTAPTPEQAAAADLAAIAGRLVVAEAVA